MAKKLPELSIFFPFWNEEENVSRVVFTDWDGQFDIAQITKFIDKIDNADIVIGYRRKRRDTFARHILMYMLRVWDLIFFGFWFRDIDCGFKMFKKESLDKIMPLRP